MGGCGMIIKIFLSCERSAAQLTFHFIFIFISKDQSLQRFCDITHQYTITVPAYKTEQLERTSDYRNGTVIIGNRIRFENRFLIVFIESYSLSHKHKFCPNPWKRSRKRSRDWDYYLAEKSDNCDCKSSCRYTLFHILCLGIGLFIFTHK